eukprot:scaffold2048_cov204-Alexandrium_tamarense.AAC.31
MVEQLASWLLMASVSLRLETQCDNTQSTVTGYCHSLQNEQPLKLRNDENKAAVATLELAERLALCLRLSQHCTSPTSLSVQSTGKKPASYIRRSDLHL